MKKYNVCILGCGNISNTRHIPALKKNKKAIFYGVVGISESKVNLTAKKHNIINKYILNEIQDYSKQLYELDWFKSVDAVIIGVPPKKHFLMVKACLELGKHVLIEKPFVMNVQEANILTSIAKEKKLVLNVMHNFQYANQFVKMENKIKSGDLGEILSIFEFQFTNRDRRLPEWYNDLPLGLFYDEAAHFIYLLNKLGGEIKVVKSDITYIDEKESTPMLLNSVLYAGKIPVNMLINFNAPICEWGLIVSCKNKLAIYDFFRDIFIIIPNDKEHLAKNVITTSFEFSFQHWSQTFINGFKMISGNLLYGHDVVIKKFIKAIETGKSDKNINSKMATENVRVMNEIIDISKKY